MVLTVARMRFLIRLRDWVSVGTLVRRPLWSAGLTAVLATPICGQGKKQHTYSTPHRNGEVLEWSQSERSAGQNGGDCWGQILCHIMSRTVDAARDPESDASAC